jgi:thiol-disulfide isomerase/thioredoxin
MTYSFGQKEAVLSGKITDPSSKMVYLRGTIPGEDGKMKQIYYDSTALNENNEFVLKAEIDSTVQASFYDGNEVAQIILSPGDEIRLTLNTAAFDETVQFYGKGAEKNNAIAALMMVNEKNSIVVNQLISQNRTDSTAIFPKNDELGESYIELVKSYQKYTPGFKAYGDQLIAQKEASTKMLKQYIRGKIEFRKKMEPLLGKAAIDFTGIDLEGNETSLSDYKGKITVIDFWATWCGPCKAEFPAYKELEAQYGEDINFVSVGVYCKEEAWKEMAKNEGFSHNIFLSKKDAKQIKDYEVRTIPRYLVLNENFELIDADAPRPSSGKLQQYWVK